MRHTNRFLGPANWWSSPFPLGSSSGERMERRCFLERALMTSACAHLGTIRTAEAGLRAPQEFSARLSIRFAAPVIIACLMAASVAAQTARDVRGAAAVEPPPNEPPAQ